MRTIDWRSFTFRDYWHLLRRRRWHIIIPLIVSFMIAVGMSITATPKYSAQTTLIANEVTESGDMVREILNLPRVAREQSITIQKRLMSHPFLMGVARKLNLPDYLKDRWRTEAVDTSLAGTFRRNVRAALVRLNLQTPRGEVTDRRVAEYLQSIMSVRVQQNFVTITVRHPNPKMAMDIANELARDYVRDTRERRVLEVWQTNRFLEEEIAQARKNLDAAEEALREANKSGLIQSLNQENIELIDKIGDADAALIRLQLQIDEKQQEINQLLSELNAVSPEVSQWQTKVSLLGTELAQLQRDFNPAWPKVVKKQEELNDAQKQLMLAESKMNETRRVVESKLKQTRSDQEKLLVEQKTVQQKQNRYKEAIDRLPSEVTNLSRLIAEKKTAEAAYNFLAQKQYEAEFLRSNVGGDAGSVATILEPALLPEVPINSATGVTIGGGIAVGLGLGIALILALEYFSHAINSVKEAEQYFKGVPVLGVVPRLHFSKP